MARIPYWNINYGILIDAFALVAVAIFVYGIQMHWKRIRQGKVRLRTSVKDLPGKIGPVFVHSLVFKGILGVKIYKKILYRYRPRDSCSGACWCFSWARVWWCSTCGGGCRYSRAVSTSWVMSFGLDLAGLLALIGVIFFLVRRLMPPERLVTPKARAGFALQIGSVGRHPGLRFSGGRTAHCRQRSGRLCLCGQCHWPAGCRRMPWPPIRLLWWGHGLLCMAFIAAIPFSPMMHILLVPTNAALADPMPGSKMGVIDFATFDDEEAEEMPTLGCASLADFTRKRLLDYSACLWCGRCHEVCPAASTGKPLSPKGVMLTLAERLTHGGLEDDGLIDEMTADAIFACTTCTACMEACPACINQPKDHS